MTKRTLAFFIFIYLIFSAKPCPKIRPPLNGILELPCFEEYGSTCSVKCKKGFILQGNEDVRCGIVGGSVNWINNNATCKGMFNRLLLCLYSMISAFMLHSLGVAPKIEVP